ncbi:hypothetical protein [Helicobacter sp. 11S02596-1]|uniref:hypothetical protein n=1 Tax=Helicobacter sp. 11S02596-1 TaxID=1476194 RepID=UPI00117A6B58|nr:hypothetical protein [Helicobacter sp. 11S02596-1]
MKNIKLFKQIILAGLATLSLSACSTQPQIVIKKVAMPIPCDVEMPQREGFTRSGDVIKDALNSTQSLMVYVRQLEHTLIFCIKGENNNGNR